MSMRALLKTLIFISFSSVVGFTASANVAQDPTGAPIEMNLKNENNKYVITYKGYIGLPLIMWMNTLDSIPEGENFTIELYSFGGDLENTKKVMKMLDQKCYRRFLGQVQKICEITTVVKSVCNSSCTSLFAMGDIRQAGKEATFGFHAVQTITQTGEEITTTIRPPEILLSVYEKTRVPQDFFKHLYESGALEKVEVTYLKSAELKAEGYVTEVL